MPKLKQNLQTEKQKAESATKELKEDIGEDDAELYNAVSVLYLDGKANGQEMGDAWDVAHAAVFLASREAKYINGVLLPVDGGLSCRAR